MRLDNRTEEFTTVASIRPAVLKANVIWNTWPHLLQQRGIMGQLILLPVLGGLFISLLSVQLQFAISSFRLPAQSACTCNETTSVQQEAAR